MIAKGAYLKELTAATGTLRSVPVGTEISGSSPPAVFIGKAGYPDVLAGPMIAPVHGNTMIMDMPEAWVSQGLAQEEIIRYRLGLVRGTRRVHAADLDNRYIGQLQDIALSAGSVESEAAFMHAPQGMYFSEEHTPHGPSAPITDFAVSSGRWHRDLERVFYDTDLTASDAITALHARNVPFSSIQKAFSAGTMGRNRRRHLVPTRWSITACDTAIGNHLLSSVKRYPILDTVRVHEFSSLHNRYAVILIPTGWLYEWTEAFCHVLGREELVFSDYEGHKNKTGYSPLGGCYYSCRMAVLEALAREQKQAGAIVLREAVRGYIPLGVFNVRENVRHAMERQGREFENLPSALAYLSGQFVLPIRQFLDAGTLLPDSMRGGQTNLAAFCP